MGAVVIKSDNHTIVDKFINLFQNHLHFNGEIIPAAVAVDYSKTRRIKSIGKYLKLSRNLAVVFLMFATTVY
jgi:hypothetical protein